MRGTNSSTPKEMEPPQEYSLANDGVHVYNEQLTLHEDAFALVRRGEIRAARAAEAVAKAKGRCVHTRFEYHRDSKLLHDRQRRAQASATREQATKKRRTFWTSRKNRNAAAKAAHSDVIKAQLQRKQRERDLQETQLAVDKAKVALAVLIFPTLQQAFEIVDDLDQLPTLETVLKKSAGNQKPIVGLTGSARLNFGGQSISNGSALRLFAIAIS